MARPVVHLVPAICLVAVLFAHAAHSAGRVGWGSAFSSWLAPRNGLSSTTPELVEGSAVYDPEAKSFSFVKGLGASPRSDAPAFGSFSDPLRHKSNFGQLRINTSALYSDELQMQAAGFLEGYLTAERIFDYAFNMKAWLAGETNDTFKIGDWLFEQDHWTRQQVQAHASPQPAAAAAAAAAPPAAAPPSASFWPAVGLALSQADGLLAGYSARLSEMGPAPPLERLTKWDFLVLNALGDMDDLMGVVFPDADDGGGTADYDDADASKAAKQQQTQTQAQAHQQGQRQQSRRRRQLRGREGAQAAERDASFFFRPDPRAEAEAEQGAGGGGKEGEAGARAGPVPRHGSWDGLSPAQVRSRIAKSGRCSALVKVTPGLDDLLLGHVTWWSYASMLRVYKHYHLQLTSLAGGRANGRVSFSSYPGQISSADDWYLLGSGLVVTETSLDIYDHNRYNASYGCTPAALLSWQRVTAANLLASDGPGWAEVAAAYNGGTYNNQYMIVDLKRFTPGQELKPGLLTIMEIIPGMSVTADATSDLEWGHWPSYNVPFFPEVYEATGYRRHAAAMAAKGPEFAAAAAGLSFQLAPRAKIFRRDAAGATDLASFRRLLRSNAFGNSPTDPLAAASPWDALCGRGDLDPDDPDTYGCFDGKVTNYRRALELSADAINGPTTEDGQPPFSWAAHPRFSRVPHRGMLETFDTEWEEQRP